MEFHPLADIFPMMSGSEFASLVEDIDKNGQIQPIFTYQGKIIDGRNRYKACEKLNLAPMTIAWDGEESELIPFVLSLNLTRRHLNESQRSMVANKLANLEKHEKKSDTQICVSETPAVSQGDAAAMLSVSPRSVQHAKTVQETGSRELIDAVEKGEVAVSTAAFLAKEIPQEKQSEIIATAQDVKIELNQEAKRIQSERAAHVERQKADPNNQWTRIISDLQVSLNSIRDHGGVARMSRNWTPEQRQNFLRRLRGFSESIGGAIRELEEATQEEYA